METTLSKFALEGSEARSTGEKNEKLKRESKWMPSTQAIIDDG